MKAKSKAQPKRKAAVKKVTPVLNDDKARSILARIAAKVNGFDATLNPQTQFGQQALTGIAILTFGGGDPINVTFDKPWSPSRVEHEDGTYTVDKGRVRDLLAYYASGNVPNPMGEVARVTAYLALKMTKSRPRSLEACNAAECLEVALSEGINLQAINGNSPDTVLDKMRGYLHYLAIGRSEGVIPPVRSPKGVSKNRTPLFSK